MKVTVSGSTVTYEPAWYPEGASVITGTSGTFSGTSTGYLTRWGSTAGTFSAGGWFTGVIGIDDAAVPFFTVGIIEDFNGHAGETAGARFARLMTDAGLAYTVLGTSAASAALGGQPEATLADLLTEIATTDDALLFDDIDAVALVLMLRNARYNQTPAIALNVTDLPYRPKEVTDDQNTHNVVTASQRDGGQYTATDTTTALGTQPPPAGVGEAKQTKDVHVANEITDLQQQAFWWLYRGTVDLPRYPQVTIDLNAETRAGDRGQHRRRRLGHHHRGLPGEHDPAVRAGLDRGRRNPHPDDHLHLRARPAIRGRRVRRRPRRATTWPRARSTPR